MTRRNVFRAIVLSAACTLAALPLLAADAVPAGERGDLWENTSQMSMAGMSGMQMPARTSQSCVDRAWSKPPVDGSDHDCQMVDVHSTATRTTWKVQCKDTSISGEGQIDRTADSYTGWMKMTMSQGQMTMTLSGKKIGDCDLTAAKAAKNEHIAQIQAQAAAAQQQQAAAMKSSCDAAVTSLNLMMLTTPASPCSDPATKTAFCGRLQTLDGYQQAIAQTGNPGTGPKEMAAFCGVDLEQVKKKLCPDALAKDDLAFVGKNCPDETQELAKRECAGRTPSALIGSKYQSFCQTYAQPMLDEAQAKQPEKKPETTKEKTKKVLKGIFP